MQAGGQIQLSHGLSSTNKAFLLSQHVFFSMHRVFPGESAWILRGSVLGTIIHGWQNIGESGITELRACCLETALEI